MPLDPKTQKIYTTLKGGGADVGTEDEFKNYFYAQGKKGYENRKKVFDTLKGGGADAGKNYEEFRDWLGLKAVTPQRKQQASSMIGGKASQATQPVQNNMTNWANPVDATDMRSEWEKQQKPKEQKPNIATETQKAVRGEGEGAKRLRAATQQLKDRADYQKETGKELKSQVDLTSVGVTPTLARDEQGAVMKDASGNPLIGYEADSTKANVQRQEDEKKRLKEQLEEAYAEREKLDAEIEEGRASAANRLLGGMLPGNQVKSGYNDADMEQSNLLSAKRLLDRRITALEAANNSSGFWGGTKDQLKDPTSWSFGLSDAEDALVMANLKKKLDAAGGDTSKLTEGERLLAENYLKNQEAQKLNEDRDWWYNAGQGFGKSLSYMKDFGVSGGGFRSIAEAAMRYGAKKGAQLASKTLGNYMAKGLRTKALGKTIETLGKGAGLVAGTEAGGFLLNNTVQAASSAADIINKNTGKLTYDKDGNLTFEGGESLGKAILTSQLSRTGENASELFGLAFDKVPGILGKVIQKTTPGKVLKNIANNKVWKAGEKGLDYLGVQSVWGEGMEEEYGMLRTEILNTLTNGEYEPNGSGILDAKKQLDTWATVGLTSMLLRAPAMIASGWSAADNYGNKYNLNVSDRSMRNTFGNDERYNAVKTAIDEADNKQLAGVLNNLMTKSDLTNEEKRAMFTYANDLVKMRGSNIGNVVAAANGYTEPPRVSNYNIRGLHVDEVDKDGNVINSYDYDNEDDLKAGLYEMQQNRADQTLQSDLMVMKARPNDQYQAFVDSYCEQFGVEPQELEEMLAKPSMERTEAEQSIVAPFADSLHNVVYDNSVLHEEQSQQDGEDLADILSLDLSNLNEEQALEAQKLTDEYKEAENALQELYKSDENIKDEIENMAGQPAQSIVSSLETFSPKSVDTVIGYYNAKAKLDGFVNRMSQKIDEEAANRRERHTFTGTINGQEDKTNIVNISDGTNTYTLVSGNVTTDGDGRITGSDTGLIIALDENGDFVQLSDSSGYGIVPSDMTLDQYQAQQAEELQLQMTSAIDPEGKLMEEQAEATAGGEDTGANGTEASPSVTQQEEPQEEPQKVEIPADKNGVKLYEQGVPVDDAIADIQNDGLDPNQYADLAINEAESELKKLKQPKTRAELVKNNAKQKELQNTIGYYNSLKERLAQMQTPVEEEPQQPAGETINETNGNVPDWSVDKASDARARGYRMENGYRVDRQQPITEKVEGNDTEVKFDKAEEPVKGKITVVEGGSLIPSHVNGQRNVMFFIDEAQPKERTDVDSEASSNRIAEKVNPEEITGGVTAYTGSPVVNSRGEVIQGNNRTIGMQKMWNNAAYEESQKKYKQYLIDHAAEFGLDPKQIEKMNNPVMVRMVDVADDEAIRLGQKTAANTESGGKERIDPQRVIQQMGDNFRVFTNQLFSGEIEDQTLLSIIAENGVKVLKWLNDGTNHPKYITDTQFQSCFDNKGNLTEEAKTDLRRIVENMLFVDAPERLADMFYKMPAKAQNAILSTIWRDSQSEKNDRIIKDIQSSIEAFTVINGASEEFRGAKDVNTARAAVKDLQKQTQMFGDTETVLEKFSNFALELAIRYKGDKQNNIRSYFNNYYDAVQGKGGSLFESAASKTKEQAIKDIFDIDINENENGTEGSNTVESDTGNGTERRPVGEGEPGVGEPVEEGEQPAVGGGGTETNEEVTQSREDYLASHPLTEEQIMADTESNEDEKLNAIDFLRGEDNSAISRFYYDQIYNRATSQPTTNPMEAIEKAAKSFREEQKSQDQQDIDDALNEFNNFLDSAKGSNVLDKFMRKGIEGNDKVQASLLDAFTLTNDAQRMFLKDLLRLASKVGYAYIKSGVHDVQAWSKKMSDSIGRKLKEVLGWDDAIVGEFVDEVWNQKYTVDGQRMRLSEHAERLKNHKGADTTVNDNKQENNEAEKVVSSQQKAAKPQLEGDSAEFAERQEKVAKLREDIGRKLRQAVLTDDNQIKTMQSVKALATQYGLDDISMTDLQELVEAEIVDLARTVAQSEEWSEQQKFDYIVKLYNSQPSLNARDNDRINKQQYSTPAPMAYLMGLFTSKGKKVESGLEPSAGNGMLTIGLPKEKMHVNDIDEMRLSNLQKQGFGEVTSQDGLLSFGEKQYDVIVTNPPFGNVTPKTYDGLYEISGLEHQMAINALESMKDDGRAAIIIGGNTEYNQNGSIKGKDRVFLNYLYAHYNVVDVINMDGKTLYSRQGTGFPVRMILINGRKEFNAKDFAPVQSKARAERVNSYDELLKRVNDDILSNENKPAGVYDTESGESGRVDDISNAGTSTQTGVRDVRTEGGEGQPSVRTSVGRSVQRSGSTTNGTDTGVQSAVDSRPSGVESRPSAAQSGGSTVTQTETQRDLFDGRDNTERPVAEPVESSGGRRSPRVEDTHRVLGEEKVPYRPQSKNPYSLQSQMPAEQADVVKKALEKLGDVDTFLVNELGYSSVEDMWHGSQSPENHGGLAADQVDSVAMAIHQMNQGNAFIIGDQTGIGKGRQAAALIRYGVKKGGCPVFITVKKALFSDMYRDLCDIGSPDLKPFIWSADDTQHSGAVTDKDGNVIYEMPSKKEQERVVEYINKNGKLPPEYDYVLTTYDSFKSGTMVYENGTKAPRQFPKGKKPSAIHYNGQAKRDALETLASSSYVIMDESHNAGGEGSNVSGYLQYITSRAKGITFLSATFAKRPGNMPIYSLKTAISKAGVDIDELIDAVKRGGATFQEIMSKALTEAGQMIRRERDMTGVTIDWKGIDDEEVVQKQREQYDQVIGLFNDIINFQRTYVDPMIDRMNDAAADIQGEVNHTPGTRDMGINNTPFASRTYNIVQQVLLSLKAEEAAKRAIEHLKAEHKPVITVANTNEGAADEVAAAGSEAIEMPDLSVNLKKGLRGTLRFTEKDSFGNTVNREIPFDSLSPEGQARYREIIDAIDKASTGLSLSPIDVIKNELKKAGYKVGELTGRQSEFVYNEDGTVNRVKRTGTDKKKTASDFNNGRLDALILNKSAGTGISLHASTKFDDQHQRVMIVAQAQGDVNDEVQIRGRIDRTGQVLRGMYEYIVSQIPSEQRLLMMLKAKLRSLDANTTSSQKSKFNEMDVQDIINKYGDDIVIQYLAEHTDLADKMCNPLKWKGDWQVMSSEQLVADAEKSGESGQTASKVLGRMALLTVREQEKMLNEIGELYQAEIDRLNEMGENDLEITEMPLKAKTIEKEVWEQGIEPGGNNPFADNSYVEKVQMDVLKKPMKAEEVKRSQARLLGGKTWEEYKKDILEKVDEWAENKKKETTETITARAEKKAKAEQERYVKGAKKSQEKNGMTDEEIEKNGQFQYNTIYQQEIDKLNDALAGIEKQKQVFVDALDLFNTDNVYAIPSNIYDLGGMTFEPGIGKLIDIKISDNYSTTASTLSFATLDGRRKITVPVSGMVKQQNDEKRSVFPAIMSLTAQAKNGMFGSNVSNTMKVLGQDIDNWDRLTSSAARKEGYIITGNLLKALVSTREQKVGGKLISYTTDTGEVRQGILMPDNFNPSGLTSKTPISSMKDELRYSRDSVVSADGDVTVRVGSWDWATRGFNTLELIVPKSKKKGEKYFNDKTLLKLMNGQFEGSSKMKAEFKRENLDAVMSRLDELGVTVQSSKDDSQDYSRRIDTTNPLEAINYAAQSFRDSQKEQKERPEVIARNIYDIPRKLGLKGAAITQVINSRDDVERLKGKVSDYAYDIISQEYDREGTSGGYLSYVDIVILFGEKLKDSSDGVQAWWHEQTHGFWYSLPKDKQDDYGKACMNFIQSKYPDLYENVINSYQDIDRYKEACSHFVEGIVRDYGADKFMNADLVGDENLCNFANELRNYLRNGRQEKGNSSNQPKRGETEQGNLQVQREDYNRRERKGNTSRSGLLGIDDPLEAISVSARRWRRKDAEEGGETPAAHSARAVYEDRLNRVETVFSEAYQDSMISLKVGQNAIAKDKDIPDSQNAYMAENLMHGKNKNEQDLFNLMFRDPLINTINRIMDLTGMNWGDVDRYVYTKSGLERNREFYVRDWLEKNKDKDGVNDIRDKWLALKEKAEDIDENYTFADYLDELTDFIKKNINAKYDPSKHDYSGFRAMFGENYDESEIIDDLMNTETEIGEDVNTLWEQINACTKYGLDRYKEAGLKSEEQIENVKKMFHWYVPMRGFKEDTGEDMYQYFTGKGRTKNYVGGLLKHAKGRGSEASYPISTIFAMTYKAIADCNQNLVNQKFYRLCQANKNDLVVLSDSWVKLNEATGEWEEVWPQITDDMSEEEIRQTTIDFEKEMNGLADVDKAKKIKGKPNFTYKPIDKDKKNEHVVEVWMNGQKKLATVVGNPRMAQALNGQLRFERGHNIFSKWNADIKNFMSSLFTSYSPTFALRNMLRDWTHFRTMLIVREGEGYAHAAGKYYAQQMPKMMSLFKKYREGTLGDSEMERDFKDFMDSGGITGFVQMNKIDEIQKEMEKLHKQMKDGNVIKLNNKVWDYTLGAVEAFNEAIENNARFATYRASRHYANRTKARSAYDAKEITVNFNRKGAGSKTAGFKGSSRVEHAAQLAGITSQILGEGRIFFNATIQAIATTFKNFQNPDGSLNKPYIAKWAAKYAAPPFLFGLALPFINQMLAAAFGGDDDDPYANLPEWTRRKNLCIYIGNNNFITIPVGQELAAFLSLGDMVAGYTYDPNLRPVDRSFTEDMAGIMNTFSPIDVDTKITKGGITRDPMSEITGRTFSVLAPLVAVEQNLSWTGRPIYREDVFKNDYLKPEYQMVYSGTNPVLVGASKILHELGGGDDITRGKMEVNPAIVQYLWEQYTGGPGKVFSNTISIGKDAKDILQGKESDFNIRKVEGLKAFVQQGDDRTEYYRVKAKYRKYKEDADKLYNDIKGYKSLASEDPTAKMKLDRLMKGEEYARMKIAREAEKHLAKIRKSADALEGAEKKKRMKEYNKLVKEVVDRLDDVQ